MKIITWNVNGVRARIEHLEDLLKNIKPSVLCLQETKVVNEHFPVHVFSSLSTNGQPAYNGVATHTKLSHNFIEQDPFGDELGKRVLSISYRGLRVINLYVPNGGKDAQSYVEKMAWLERLHQYLRIQCSLFGHVVVTGDFNICPTDSDCADPKAWRGSITCTEPERKFFRKLLSLGFVDVYRHTTDDPGYTWFDYRYDSFRRDQGLRIDHFLVTKSLLPYVKNCKPLVEYRKLERPSDHVPLLLEIKR